MQPAGSKGGENYGWDRFEGSLPFEGEPPAKHVLPIHEYQLGGGNCAVTGGYVYRGKGVPDLSGVYLFADATRQALDLRVPYQGVGTQSTDVRGTAGPWRGLGTSQAVSRSRSTSVSACAASMRNRRLVSSTRIQTKAGDPWTGWRTLMISSGSLVMLITLTSQGPFGASTVWIRMRGGVTETAEDLVEALGQEHLEP